jgi:Ca-activated chloride channel homolog
VSYFARRFIVRVPTVFGLSALGALVSALAVSWLLTPTRTARAAETELVSSPVIDAPASRVAIAGALELEARVGNPVIAAGGAQESYLLFRLKAAERSGRAESLHTAVLIDRSGSMRGRRLDNALVAARGLVRRMRVGDRISIATYDTSVVPLIPTTRIDEDTRPRVLAALSDESARGNTCISCALESGLASLEGSTAPIRQIVLLSDGEATAGVRTLDGFAAIARRAREHGVGVSSIGVDVDYNEALLTTIARLSNGRHHFVRNPEDLARAFDEELGALAGSVASDAVLEVELPSGVELERVFDRDVERNDNRLTVRFGAFASGDEKTLLLQVRIPEGGPRQLALASFSLRYQRSGGAAAAVDGNLGMRVSDVASEVSPLDPFVAARLSRSRTGALLRQAGKGFETGDARDFKKVRDELGAEIERLKGEQRKHAKSGGAALDFDDQAVALEGARDRLTAARAGHCGCAPADLQCAMRCSARPSAKPRAAACSPGDPLCADVGDLSPDEKAAAKESVGDGNRFSK